VPAARWQLWLWWVACVGILALEVAAPRLFPHGGIPWDDAQTAVGGFVAAIFSFTAGVWSFAWRESFARREVRTGALDPSTPAGFGRARAMLFWLWGLCLLVALFGALLAWAASRPRAVLPYGAGAAVLLLIHAPRGWLFSAPEAQRP
jgi:hypothetical protein